MRRFPWVLFLFLFLFLTVSLAAQQPPAGERHGEDAGATEVAPQQVRIVEPPSPHAPAPQLERSGDQLRHEKMYADALDYYRAALKKEPKSAVLHNKAGITQMKMLRYREAKKDFERAIRLDGQYAEAHNNLGVIEYVNRKYRRAIRHYSKAVELQPERASFFSNLGTAHFARRDYKNASVAYLRALELDPAIFERQSEGGVSAHLSRPEDRARFAYTMAKMLARLGETERCLLYLRRAMEEGYRQIDNVYRDEEFAQVREDPRFAELMAAPPAPLP
jgi:tetratricopeptide (TPR) repeat protein